jgi:hypothetical protein
LYWFANDVAQIVEPRQIAIMMIGDVVGVVLGALIFKMLLALNGWMFKEA